MAYFPKPRLSPRQRRAAALAAKRKAEQADLLKEAHVAYLTAVLLAFAEASELGFAHAKEPEYQRFAALMRDAEAAETDYFTLKLARIAKKRDLPPEDPPPVGAALPLPAPLAPSVLVDAGESYQAAPGHLVEEAHACAGDKQRCFMPAKHFHEGTYYCGIHCPLSEQEDR